MAELTLATELFAGALVWIAPEAAGTSDPATKPVAGNAAWLELASVEKLQHKRNEFSEDADVPDADIGWRTEKRVYTLADWFEVVTRRTTALFHQLSMGLATTPVAATAQTPFIKSDRKIRGWVKVQLRQHIGTDRYVMDFFAEIRVSGDDPAAEKAIQKPNLEFYVVKSTLNAFNIPS